MTYKVIINESGELVIENPYGDEYQKCNLFNQMFWFGLPFGLIGSMLVYVGCHHVWPQNLYFKMSGSLMIIFGLLFFFMETCRRKCLAKPDDIIHQGIF